MTRLVRTLRGLCFRARSVPVALLLLLLLSFGLLIPWLGFYWDDWPTVWYLHQFGPAGFREVFAVDRPVLGWLFMLVSPFSGASTVAWQLFAIFTRWLCCLGLLWTLRTLWPRRAAEVTWAVFLFAVYPGFLQQPISVTYSLGWITMGFFILSLGLMILAARRPALFWPLTAASLLLTGISMFADEYYFGLELLRPVLLWIVLTENEGGLRGRLGEITRRVAPRIVGQFAPYAAMMAAFLYWRLFVHVSPRGQVQIAGRLADGPLQAVAQLARQIGEDVFQAGLLAWAQVFDFSKTIVFGGRQSLIYFGVILATLALALVYLLRLRFEAPGPQTLQATPGAKPDRSDKAWAVQAVLLGGYALLLAGWPFWVTNLPIDLRFPWDRFTLPMILGASLLVAGLLVLLTWRAWQRAALLAVLLAFAAGWHFQNENAYRQEWHHQKNFFWQLTWRAPGLTPGSVVITSDMPFNYFSDNSLTAPLNWTYAPEHTGQSMPYLMYAVESRLGQGLASLAPGQTIDQEYRANRFSGSTSQAVVAFYSPPGCVRLIDPLIDANLPQKRKNLSEALPLSRLDLIIPQPESAARPPERIFGREPEQGWCYYYEKAELARQLGDWPQVAELGDQALALGQLLYEVNAPELVPYIEAYAHTGQWDKAEKLSREAVRITPWMDKMVCAAWGRIQRDTPAGPEQQAALTAIKDKFRCPAIPEPQTQP